MSSGVLEAQAPIVAERRLSWGARLGLVREIVAGGFVELWAHKLRSLLTLTLLMLGVFALVVMTSVLDGVMDKVSIGFSGMSWDGTVVLQPKTAETTEEQVFSAAGKKQLQQRLKQKYAGTGDNDIPNARRHHPAPVDAGTVRFRVSWKLCHRSECKRGWTGSQKLL